MKHDYCLGYLCEPPYKVGCSAPECIFIADSLQRRGYSVTALA